MRVLQIRRSRAAVSAVLATALAVTGLAAPGTASAAVSRTAPVVISEVYGGGGNAGSTLKNDFIELYNPGTAAIDVSSWSVQYASAAGTSWQTTRLTGSIQPGEYYLVQEAAGNATGGGTQPLPSPDVTGVIAMSGTAGKVALVSSATALSCGSTCRTDPAVVDLVGFGATANDFAGSGPTVAPSNSTSVARDSAVANAADNAADFTAGAPTPGAGVQPPAPPVARTIQEIQGSGSTSPFVNTAAITDGVVTAAYPTGGFNGYYLQTPGTGGAIDLASHTTSDALFVYSPATVGSVTVGQHVRVTGTVGEFAGQTQLSVADASGLEVLTDTVTAPTAATTTTLPATAAQRESLEGMLYRPSGSYTITNTFNANNFGELGLAAGTRPLIQPTEIARPGTAAYTAAVADNAARGIVLDDGSSTNFLSGAGRTQTPPYLADPAQSGQVPPRVGAPVTFTRDVIFAQGGSTSSPTYRFQPLSPALGGQPATYLATWTNTRTTAPDATRIGSGDLRIASFNVLNYFTLLGQDMPAAAECTSFDDRDGNPVTVDSCDGVPNGPRGAWTPQAQQRQQAKIVAAILGSGADVAGLMEVENALVVGQTKDQALATLVDALNAQAGAGVWAYVPSSTDLPDPSEMDVINSAIIYQPAKLTPVGDARALGTQSGTGGAFENAREPIAQLFQPAGTGADPFWLVVNHFKSKGSGSGDDADQGDGQGASNASRVRQATALRDWIGSINTGDDAVVSVGDYNSYSQEDPLQVLYGAGYTDAEAAFPAGKYSYSFSGLSGSLDHALLNAKALARTTGADIWNINSPESVALEYSRYNYHPTNFYAPDPYAASDHDPVVIGFKAQDQPTTLNLVNINDFHGRIDTNTVKFAGTVEQLRAAGGPASTALLSAGDNVSASLYASAFEDDKPTIDVLNALELKASAVGNHEFDKGFADLKNRIQAPYDATTNPLGGADWKYLGANVYAKGTTTPVLPEYQIVLVGGLRVGVIGAVTQETPSLVSPGGIADLDFGDPVAAVNRVAAQLTDGDPANGEADVLVAEYHEGAGAGTPDGATLEDEVAAGGVFAEIVTQTSPEVAAIFTGHTHKQYAWEGPVPGQAGKTRPILQTGSYGENIGQITLTVQDGVVTAHTVRNVPRTTVADGTLISSYPRVARVNAITQAALQRAQVAGSVPVGSVAKDITTAFSGDGAGYTGPGGTYTAPTRDDRANESALGGLVADALVAQLSPQQYGGAEIGVVNPGGLRAELLQAPDGTITTAEAVSVLPFANNLNTVTLTGAQFKTLLEQQWQTNKDGTIPSRPYLQLGLSKNVSYTYDAAAAQGSHITSITIDGVPYDPAASYRIGTFSFLLTGGDNFRIFTAGTDPKDSGLVDRDAWIAYLQANPGLQPSFARRAVSLPVVPTTAKAGSPLSFTLGGLNLTSLGSPANTAVTVEIGGTTLGTVPVSSTTLPGSGVPDAKLVGNGTAAVSLTVPSSVPTGPQTVTVTAVPSGTTVRFPVTVQAADPVATTTTLTVSPSAQVYRAVDPATLTATVTATGGAAGVGTVRFLQGTTVLGTAALDAEGRATLPVPTTLPVGRTAFTAEFVPATGSGQLASTSTEVPFRVAVVSTTTAVAVKVVTLSAADRKKFGVRSGLVVSVTVRSNGSTAPLDGVAHLNVSGRKSVDVRITGGRGTSTTIPVAPGTAFVTAGFDPASSAVLRSSGFTQVVVPR